MKSKEFVIFPWSKNLETGISEIDEQHKMIVVLVNRLAANLMYDEPFQIEETFNELVAYADYHFKSEEVIWEKYIDDDELVESHKASHDAFLPKVFELVKNDLDTQRKTEEILLFLIRWLAFHIADSDKKLALVIKFLNEGKNLDEAVEISEQFMSDTFRGLVETILSMYDNISLKAIDLIKERKIREQTEKTLRELNEKLTKLSVTDPLTGLYNRRHFDDVFSRELNRAKRNKSHIGLILFDIDFFKKINDTYGHIKGDDALKSLASAVMKCCQRSNDFTFRIGGEEFCILITNENIEEMISVSDKLKEKIKNLYIENKKSDVSKFLTVSGGIVSLQPGLEDTKDTILNIADQRLYKAKNNGRNKFIWD